MSYDDVWLGGATCKVDGTIAQIAAAPTPMGFRIACAQGTEFYLLSYHIKIGTVGAARATTVKHVDSGNNPVMGIFSLSLDDNWTGYGPVLRTVADDQQSDHADTIGVPYIPYLIPGGEKLQLTGASLANGETYTIRIRLRLRGAIPTLEAIGTDISTANLAITVI